MGGRGLDAACSVGPVPGVDRWAVGCSRWVGPTGDLAGRDPIWCRCRAGDSAAVAVEAAAVWGSSWVVEAAAPDLEAAGEAGGAAAVWISGWVVEAAAAAAATAATAAATTAAAEWQSWSRVVQADGRAVEAHLERVQEGVQEAAEGNKGRSGELSCGGRAGGGSDVDGLGTGQGEESTGGSSSKGGSSRRGSSSSSSSNKAAAAAAADKAAAAAEQGSSSSSRGGSSRGEEVR